MGEIRSCLQEIMLLEMLHLIDRGNAVMSRSSRSADPCNLYCQEVQSSVRVGVHSLQSDAEDKPYSPASFQSEHQPG